MTPVINPILFYFMSVADALRFVLIILTIIYCTILGLIVCYMLDFDELGQITKHIKKIIAIFIVFILGIVFIPSQNTIIKMLIAQNITYERLDKATCTVESVYSDIIKLFDNMENKK